jgi:hypothetical protein
MRRHSPAGRAKRPLGFFQQSYCRRPHEYSRIDHVQDLWQSGGRGACDRRGALSLHGSPSPAATANPDVSSQPVVDVGNVLTDLASKSGQPLNWRTSIVDLMKLLGLDSSLDHRKELAKELNYTGDTADSASMNVWLHKQVMQKLAENGGKVPSDLVS